MKSLAFKPESFTYYSSSGTYYVNGVVTESLIDNDNIVIRRGTSAQLFFTADVGNFDRERLFRGEVVRAYIEPYAREGRIRAKGVRLTVIHFDEDSLWRDL